MAPNAAAPGTQLPHPIPVREGTAQTPGREHRHILEVGKGCWMNVLLAKQNQTAFSNVL